MKPAARSLLTGVLVVVAVLLPGPAACAPFPLPVFQRNASQPLPITATDKYNPRNKDWASVVSACLAAGYQEKRLFNFFTRASFHDSMAVPTVPCGTCAGGADGSLFLTAAELARAENMAADDFALNAARVVKRIAALYNTSVSDTLAVCGLVSAAGLTKGQYDIFRYTKLRVGRIDSYKPAKPDQLPPGEVGPAAFSTFWTKRGFSVEEGLALTQGSHSLIIDQGCSRGMVKGKEQFCDPSKGADCSDVKMFQFDNHFFVDGCTPGVPKITPNVPPIKIKGLRGRAFTALLNTELCKWTSKARKDKATSDLRGQQNGTIPVDLANVTQVTWPNPKRCPAGTLLPMKTNCPHAGSWGYTIMDAKMAQVCQNPRPTTTADKRIKRAMIRFAQSNKAWQFMYARSYAKMVSKFATWVPGKAFSISGKECASGWRSAQRSSGACFKACKNRPSTCPLDCVCATAFRMNSQGLVMSERDMTGIVH